MSGIELAAALNSGRRAHSTLITSVSPHLPERLRNIRLDFVFIDTEHISIDDHDLSWMCQDYIHSWENLEQEIDWARHGANLFPHSADVLLFISLLRKELDMARLAPGDHIGDVDDVLDAV